MIKFDVSRTDLKLIEICADRAARLGLVTKDYPRMHLMMDLEATKAQGCPIDFHAMLGFDDFSFTHDITGIARHLDRDDESKTGGKLLNCFVPRAARFKMPAHA